MEDQWRISKHDPEWKKLFNDIASKLRTSLGDLAIRIDHVGSTSVVGLDAKPIIDIQISIINFDDILAYKTKIEQVGFVLRKKIQTERRGIFGKHRALEGLIFM